MSKSSTKGSKKSRRFNRPRSPLAIVKCAKRKVARIAAQNAAHERNVERGYTAWDEARTRRNRKRH